MTYQTTREKEFAAMRRRKAALPRLIFLKQGAPVGTTIAEHDGLTIALRKSKDKPNAYIYSIVDGERHGTLLRYGELEDVRYARAKIIAAEETAHLLAMRKLGYCAAFTLHHGTIVALAKQRDVWRWKEGIRSSNTRIITLRGENSTAKIEVEYPAYSQRPPILSASVRNQFDKLIFYADFRGLEKLDDMIAKLEDIVDGIDGEAGVNCWRAYSCEIHGEGALRYDHDCGAYAIVYPHDGAHHLAVYLPPEEQRHDAPVYSDDYFDSEEAAMHAAVDYIKSNIAYA